MLVFENIGTLFDHLFGLNSDRLQASETVLRLSETNPERLSSHFSDLVNQTRGRCREAKLNLVKTLDNIKEYVPGNGVAGNHLRRSSVAVGTCRTSGAESPE